VMWWKDCVQVAAVAITESGQSGLAVYRKRSSQTNGRDIEESATQGPISDKFL